MQLGAVPTSFGLRCLFCLPQQGEKWFQAAVRRFGLGLLLGLLLHGLWNWGRLPLLSYGLLGGGAVAFLCWLNLYLFADWQNYGVVERDHSLIACGKLTYGKTQAVLADVIVSPNWRGQGVGAFLIRSIIDQAALYQGTGHQVACQPNLLNSQAIRPIYLACSPRLMPFYQRFGFQPLELSQLSFALRQELGLRRQPALRAMVLAVQQQGGYEAKTRPEG
jgi:N-acetylglutamate synthase-like GNAT family acetyltransferase